MKWLLCVAVLAGTFVWAEDEDESFTTYDSIVNDLKVSTEDVLPPIEFDPWNDVAIYGGLGIATSFVSVELSNGNRASGLLKGIQAHFGIDLFTKHLRAEGAFRAFAQESLNDNSHASLKEFELRGVFLPAPYGKNVFRMGGGITARYLDVSTSSDRGWTVRESSTPASVIFMGLERRLTKTMAIGPDISYRSPLIEETIDKAAWDVCFKVNATF